MITAMTERSSREQWEADVLARTLARFPERQ